MSAPKPKKAKTDGAPTGLALPPPQPAPVAVPPASTRPPTATTPSYSTAPPPVIDPSLQAMSVPSASNATTSKVAQASSGYLNSGVAATTPAYPYPYGYYGYQYPQGTTAAHPYGYAAYAYPTTQQYGATPITAAPTTTPYAPTTTTTTLPAAATTLPGATTTAHKTTAAAAKAAPAQPALDNSSFTDVIGSAGVDIRAEEEAMTRDLSAQQAGASTVPREDRSRKQNFLDPVVLANRVKEITTNHTIQATTDAQTYIALALQYRLTSLIKESISAVDHRLDSQFTRPPPLYPIDDNVDPESGAPPEPAPMWGLLVRRDIGKQLAALEKIDREEENRIRRRRRERDENEAAGMSATANGNGSGDVEMDGGDDDDEASKKRKKKKKEGPGVTAKNMSDEVRKKMSDMVANDFAGGFAKKYAWMQGGAAVTPMKPTNPKPATSSTPPTAPAPATTGGGFVRPFGVTKAATAANDPEERAITLADLMFVVQKEKGHGAGKGSARTWSVAGW